MSNLRVAVAFLARWGLLGAAGLIVAGAVAGAAYKAGHLPRSFTVFCILPDSLWGQGKIQSYREKGNPIYMAGVYDLRGLGPSPKLFCSQDSQSLRRVLRGKYEIWPRIVAPHLGPNLVSLTGAPYSSLAFQRELATLTVVPQNKKIFLLDSHWLVPAWREQRERVMALLVQCWRLGQPAVVHPGPLDAFVRDRDELRQASLDLPILCTGLRAASTMAGLWNVVSTLQGQSLNVITDDPVFAVEAAADPGKRYHVHLLAPTAVLDRPRLTSYPSAAKLEETLASQPIGP